MTGLEPDPAALAAVQADVAVRYCLPPIRLNANAAPPELTIVVGDVWTSLAALDNVRRRLRCRIDVKTADAVAVRGTIERANGG